MDDDIPYLLLTPGPLTTTRSVRQAMQQDLSTWDVDYNQIVESIRRKLVHMLGDPVRDTAVLMQGSGTFAVESTIGSVIPTDGRLLVVRNGAYGKRILQIAERLRIPTLDLSFPETQRVESDQIKAQLEQNPGITHVAVVHCETTTGILNPIDEVGRLVAGFGVEFIVDAMSSAGGIPLTLDDCNAQYVISSANKCVQGVPGFGFVVARRGSLERTQGWARSLSLDLYDQWAEMERNGGKWRYTSPTHVVCAFQQALAELEQEGGPAARFERYRENQHRLVRGLRAIGFRTLLPDQWHSPVITSFHAPIDPRFSFTEFYNQLKQRRFVIYPGKVTDADTFRIGTIGNVFPHDVDELVSTIADVIGTQGWTVS